MIVGISRRKIIRNILPRAEDILGYGWQRVGLRRHRVGLVLPKDGVCQERRAEGLAGWVAGENLRIMDRRIADLIQELGRIF